MAADIVLKKTAEPDGAAAAATRGETDVPGRGCLTVTETRTPRGRGLHICGHEVLSGSNYNLWFPVGAQDDLFAVLEAILVWNGVAVNLVRLSALRECTEYTDWLATFNRVPRD